MTRVKLLDGKELAGFIKQRQAKDVRRLKASKIIPKLAIVQVKDDPVINTYVRLKKQYGADIAIEVELHTLDQKDVPKLLNRLSNDKSVHGIIIQLPLSDPSQTDEIVNMVAPQKDVDALGKNAKFEPATPMAILWLLHGYNVEVVNRKVKDLAKHTKQADIIITATGSPAVLYPDMIKQGAVVVDAGVASEEGKTVGDLSPEVYKRDDLTVTPEKGGVGPLTVCALFENVIRAAQNAKS